MKNNESSHQVFADYTIRPVEGRSRKVIVFKTLLILFVVVFGSLFIIGAMNKKQKTTLPAVVINTPTITPLPTSSVSAVLKPNLTGEPYITSGLSSFDKSTNLDRSELQITVLNGSGEKGAAKQVSLYLEGLGYKIVKVANANTFTYRNLTIQVKRSKSAYVVLLKKDLQLNPIYASVSASVSDEISSEAEVIVGK